MTKLEIMSKWDCLRNLISHGSKDGQYLDFIETPNWLKIDVHSLQHSPSMSLQVCTQKKTE
ncbi:hypothetical protein EGH82_20270 [Vibrio ponticus]|uniref:Uncharacterized protein n=1 Tax=Vibrio ponticus TaxID=265668 RepID=A0A3N3DU87_9VIBR|nr:hypothetical protein EGH82_20270 [Vibrio ponticus]